MQTGKDGLKLYVGACDSHFVAFNTDKPIDRLFEADVYYTTQSYSKLFAVGVGEKVTFGEKKENYAYLKYTDKVPYFDDKESATTYVDESLSRKYKNFIARRVRMTRKANLADFNFFVTFTYSDELHTEETFRKKLKNTLSLFSYRKGWKYIGVWERSPEKKRLHFHGMFYIPEGTMPGKMKEVSGYNFSEHKRKVTHENSYFSERFGRNDFDSMVSEFMLDGAVTYILKYVEKSGEKIVYSRGLPQFFISDIMEDDVICLIGEEDQKLLLFDNFSCWDEGCYVGKVSKGVIEQMPKCN